MDNKITEIIGNDCGGPADAALRLCIHIWKELDASDNMHVLEFNRARDLFWSAGLLIITAMALTSKSERDSQQEALIENAGNVDYASSGKIH